MTKEYTIYSKWLAAALRNQGFKLIRTGVNQNFPQYDTYVFEDTPDLHMAVVCLSEDRKKRNKQ